VINLRFHIVSLVAVFLALALGIFVGSTLLDRATVDYLKASRERVDERNRRLRAENDALRAEAEAAERREAAFGEDALEQLRVEGLDEVQVLVLATRGIDEGVAASVAASVTTAGGRSAGVVWFDERADLSDDERAAALAEAWGSDDARPASVRRTFPSEVAASLAEVATAPTAAPDGGPTTTVAPDPGVAPAPDDAGAEPSTAPAVIDRLVAADLADWEDPTDTDPSPSLEPGSLVVVALVGEGAVVDGEALTLPLVRSLAEEGVDVAVGEVRRPRTQRQLAEATDEPARGSFIEPFRGDEDLAEAIVTVDDVDEPLGRAALLLALGRIDRSPAGRYGEADSADRLFPEPGA